MVKIHNWHLEQSDLFEFFQCNSSNLKQPNDLKKTQDRQRKEGEPIPKIESLLSGVRSFQNRHEISEAVITDRCPQQNSTNDK